MEIVVFRSDIARLVLGYIKNQKLDKAARIFCKTSPHLTEEFSAYKQGLQGYSFFPDLEEIICEYVKITQKVDETLRQLPESLREKLQFKKLSEKVYELLGVALRKILTETDLSNEENKTIQKSETYCTEDGNTKKLLPSSKRKRLSESTYTSDEQKHEILHKKYRKRRRINEPFCFLGGKRLDLLKKVITSESTSDEKSNSSAYISNDAQPARAKEKFDTEQSDDISDIEISDIENPIKESTPRNKFAQTNYQTPSLPEISQAILDNSAFQTKLVENINDALKSATKSNELANVTSETQQILNTNQMLDDMVRNILAATEKDPAFDAIIEEVVGSSHKTHVSTAVQCDIEYKSNERNSHSTSNIGASLQMASSHLNTENILSSAKITTQPPHTPLIIRNAVAAGNSIPNNNDIQTLPVLPANTSFGSLIDPNFSISKLIVLNSNDSAQKQHPDSNTAIGNLTADNLLTQLNHNATENTLDDQVHLDVASGQLTFPLFLTNDGLLTNLPFLLNNEIITQQLQAENISNLESSRIEISLPEPIIVKADQLPPNSRISGSTKKLPDVGESLSDINRTNPQKTVSKIKANTVTAVPSSLDSRWHAEKATPSSCGIVNTKAYKSLSTPRKRASHVRTLTFSPKSLTVHTINGLATPLSTRRETVKRLQKSIIENSKADHLVSEKPIIKNIEILPRIAGGSALDNSANESGNNGNVPPLFVTEECSNQTIIKCEEGKLKLRNIVKEKPKKTNSTKIQSTETPKRRQLRKNAVRACKRQLSKSPKKEILEKIEVANTNESQENTKSTNEDIQNSKIGEKKEDSVDLMEEWLRMRSCTASNLDSRLREINASKGFTKPIKKVTKKKVQRKKEALKAKDKEASNDADESNDKEKVSVSNEGICSKKEISSVGQIVNIIESQSIEKSQKENQKEKDKKKPPKDKQREFNIKILTPHKSKDKKIEIDLSKSLDKRDNTKSNSLDEKGFIKQSSSNNTCSSKAEECVELEKRTANIACLLETPFKDPNILDGTVIPPTPGIFAHNLDTPLSKMRTTSDNMHTTSFLFGSLTKSELDTPMLSAITPGLRFTPFCSKDATPRSVATTEYSSGGSYYRPDESDELNRNIEKMLKNSAQKQSSDEIQQQSKRIFEADLLDDSGGKDTQCTKHSAVSVEIPAATLKVEPIVLKRVKSFGSDIVTGNDAEIVSKLDPHYTLVCGLPELSAIEDECSSSSSSSSSTTSSSSKSSSSSNTNSTFSSTSGKVSELTLNKISNNLEKAKDNHKSLEQLSEISSAEDEDWQKLVVTDGEDSQLVSNDGEVRYPVRSWLTPNKDKNFSESQTTFKVSLPLMSSEKRNRQLAELEEKRERLKEKLKDDTSKQKKEKVLQSAPGSRAAMAATRSLQAMHKTSFLSTPKSHQVEVLKFSNATKISKSPEKVEEPRTIEVLTALQLSAKNEISTSKSSLTKTSTEVTKKCVHITTPKRRKCLEIAAKSLSLSKSQVSATNPRNRANLNRNKTSNAQQKSNLIKDIKRCDRASKLTSIKVKSAKRVSPRLSKLANPESLKITEHPKLLSKNEQSTRKNIQRTSTKTDFDKNKSSSPVIMAMDKRENMADKIKLKENSIERSPNKCNNSCKNSNEEDANAKSKQVSTNCPNQHNNIESKILDEVVLTDSEMYTRNYEKNVEAIEVISCSKSKDEIIAVQSKITAIEDNQTDSSEEWVLKSSLDTEKNCFQVLFDESNSQIKVSEKTNDIANFFMGLEIEGQGTHTLRVSEEICLFTLNSNGKEKLPQPIKNIPKKRRMRITTSDDSDGPSKQINPNAKLYISTETANKCIIPNMPQAISTPLPVNRADPQDTQENPKENKSFKSSPITSSSMYNEPIPTNTEEKIKIDDIENILSQLHGA